MTSRARRVLPGVIAAAVLVSSGCAATVAGGPTTAAPSAPPAASPPPVVRDSDDWTMPDWVRPAAFSGFFSESASPKNNVDVHAVDLTWRQIAPTEDGPLDLKATGSAEGMSFDGLGSQLAQPGAFWLRLFASGKDWAPAWVTTKCRVTTIGPDYEGNSHLPLWNACVWSALRDTWRRLLVDGGILANPQFRFAYIPGGFTWSEFDYDVISQAVKQQGLTKQAYLAWFDRMLADLKAIAGDHVGQLVFTGEDYPWGPFGGAEDLLATKAVHAGFGVRTGITEEFNFHLNQTPAYGSTVGADGHLTLNRTSAAHQVFASENECYTDCGYHAKDVYYAVVGSNLKALQLQLNWLYVVPADSYLAAYAEHWNWVRLSLGQQVATAPDAWVALRDAQDTYWADQPVAGVDWKRRPWVRNLERWLVQVDAPGAVAHRSTADVRTADPTRENGTAYEGLRTDLASANSSLAFRLDQNFLPAGRSTQVAVKVTFLDDGGSFSLRYPGGRTPAVMKGHTKAWRTATFQIALSADHSLADSTDLWLDASGSDLTARFVRVVRTSQP